MMELSRFLLLMATVAMASAVTELSDENFFNYAKDKDVLLVDFYAPWCSDCEKLAPEFERAAGSLGTRSFNMAKVDCFGTGKGLCQMYGVKSWPQLKNFNRGSYTGDYQGAQTGEAMAAYINTVADSVAGPAGAAPVPAANPYAAMNAQPVINAPAYAAGQPFGVQPAYAKPGAPASVQTPGCTGAAAATARCQTHIKAAAPNLARCGPGANRRNCMLGKPKPLRPRDQPDDKRSSLGKLLVKAAKQ